MLLIPAMIIESFFAAEKGHLSAHSEDCGVISDSLVFTKIIPTLEKH